MIEQTEAYLHTPVSIGPDWLTATATAGLPADRLQDVGETIISEQRAAGVEVEPAALRDYRGRRCVGCFVGKRPDGVIVVLSGPRCPPNFKRVTQAASNVSRLDLQVTVWTHGEQPRLAQQAYTRLKELPPSRGRAATLTYIERHPQGETLNYGSRTSDSYGRLYDKASESKLGEARTLWRYEVEFKRQSALRYAHALSRLDDPACAIESLVHAWWGRRRVHPSWSLEDRGQSVQLDSSVIERDVLRWFETSVSRTVARAVNRHGLDAVLSALGLSGRVQPIGGTPNASTDTRSKSIQDRLARRTARPTDAE